MPCAWNSDINHQQQAEMLIDVFSENARDASTSATNQPPIIHSVLTFLTIVLAFHPFHCMCCLEFCPCFPSYMLSVIFLIQSGTNIIYM